MIAWARTRWLSYFYSGACALVISWVMAVVFSGCYRFGNYEQDQVNPDPVSGYYETAPTGLTFQTVTTTGTQTVTPVTDMTLVPAFLSDIASDPVQVQVTSLSTWAAQISSPLSVSNGFALPVTMDTANSTFQGPWANPVVQVGTCILSLSINTMNGKYTDTGPFNSPAASQGVPMKGRLIMEVVVEWTFSGTNCAAAASCYFDATQCQQTSDPTTGTDAFTNDNQAQQWYKNAVDPMVKAGLMTTSDFQNYSDLDYAVWYQ